MALKQFLRPLVSVPSVSLSSCSSSFSSPLFLCSPLPSSSLLPLCRRSFHSSSPHFASIVINVPHIADSINEGTLVEFVKSIGESVAKDGIVAKIETDKVLVEVRSPKEGVITEHLAKPGATVLVGGPLFSVDPDGKPGAVTPKPSTPAASTPSPTPTPTPPSLPTPSPSQSKPSSSQSSASSHHHPHNSLIRFRYGKREHGSSSSSDKSSAISVNANDWQRDNDRAYQAWLELPSRYKRSVYTEEWQAYVDLGGAKPDPPKPVAKDGAKPAKKK